MTTIKAAFLTILGVCDGAHARDGAGFNAADAGPARRLYRRVEVWRDCDDYEAYAMLRKYAGQLTAAGIDYAELAVPAKPALPTSARIVTREGGKSVLLFAFAWGESEFDAIKSRVKALAGGGGWDSARKCWRVPFNVATRAAILDLIDAYDFELSAGAIDLLNSDPAEIPTPAPIAPQPAGTLTQCGAEWCCKITRGHAQFDALLTAIKALPKRRYNPENYSWCAPGTAALLGVADKFELSGREALRTALEAEIAKAAEAAQAADALTEQLWDALPNLSEPLPGAQQITLRGHQREAVRQLLARKRAILAHDMGLGKTLTALVAAKAAQTALDARVFVVAPVSLRTNWLREAAEAGVQIEFFSWAKVPQSPTGRAFVAIFDEAHYMQNLKSKRTQGALELAEKATLAFFLTGTPIKNGRPVNLFPLLKGCRHSLAADRHAYEVRYCAARQTRFCPWDVTGAAHLDELHERTQDVLFRRTKKQCLDLPEFTRIKRETEVSGDALKTYRVTCEELCAQYTGAQAGDVLALLTKLRVAGSQAKIEQAIELAEEVIEQGGQVLLSTQFQESAHVIARALGCEWLTGETPGEARQQMVDRFQSGQCKALVFTGGAGGVGLNLQAASTVIMVDRPWTPGDAEQIESRAHRSGQQNAVTSIWLQFGAVDAKVDSILEQKAERIELVLEGERKTMRGTGGSIQDAALAALREELGIS